MPTFVLLNAGNIIYPLQRVYYRSVLVSNGKSPAYSRWQDPPLYSMKQAAQKMSKGWLGIHIKCFTTSYNVLSAVLILCMWNIAVRLCLGICCCSALTP
jgi:hypothetical protein